MAVAIWICLGVGIAFGFTAMSGRAHAHTKHPSDSHEQKDEADFREFMKKIL